jgi:hypothetical protein
VHSSMSTEEEKRVKIHSKRNALHEALSDLRHV